MTGLGGHFWARTASVGLSRLVDLSSAGLHGEWAEAAFDVTGGARGWEAGGPTLGATDRQYGPYAALNGGIGFREQDAGRGLVLRALFSGTWILHTTIRERWKQFIPVGGVSLGFTF